jgi:hypothetical protein
VQQLAVQKADALDNLYTLLCCQTCSRKITSACVPLMVARLGANWTSASCRELVYPIVQTMVVLEEIRGIASHEEYEEFIAANKASEGTLFAEDARDVQQRRKGHKQQDKGACYVFLQG